MPGCDAASVTIIERGRPTTAGTTSDLATVDLAQYAADDGPCLTAAIEQRTIVISDARNEPRWSKYRTAALEHGVHSSISAPSIGAPGGAVRRPSAGQPRRLPRRTSAACAPANAHVPDPPSWWRYGSA